MINNKPDPYLDWFRNAAPYFNANRGRCLVVHFSGELLLDKIFPEFIHDLALLHSLGVKLVLVPGIRPQLDARLQAQQLDYQIFDGIRVTTAAMVPALRDAVATVMLDLQARLSMGLASTPMRGARIRVASGNYVTARPWGIRGGVDFGFSGEVRRIDHQAIHSQIDNEHMVIIAPLGFSPGGELFNLRSEDLAARVAVELKAHKLIFMAAGATVKAAGGERIGEFSLEQAQHYLQENQLAADSAARRRFESAINACRLGVQRVHLLEMSLPGALALELYSRDGIGTMINDDGYDAVRPADSGDVAGILELIAPLEDSGVLVRREREEIESDLGNFYVEERDGVIVACALAHWFAEEALMELACLAVREDHRAAGRGEILLTSIEQRARRLGAKSLFVLTTQTDQWFRERGFVETELYRLPATKQNLYNAQRASKVLLKNL